jgi:trans-2-enoyl-CoA reductase
MVTYGGMSRQPVITPTTHLIFNDLRLRGYWMTRWVQVNSMEARLEMLNALAKLSIEGKFSAPQHKLIPLDNFKEAVEGGLKGYAGTKYIFTF